MIHDGGPVVFVATAIEAVEIALSTFSHLYVIKAFRLFYVHEL